MQEEKSAWEFLKEGKFAEACSAADAEFKKYNSYSRLGNKVLALLNMQDYISVIDLCEELIGGSKGESDFDYLFLGCAHWLLNETENALNAWKAGLKTKYTDAAGGVEIPALILFASIVRDEKSDYDISMKMLRKRWKSKQRINWPGAIAGYLLGEIDEQCLLGSMSDTPLVRDRQNSQALFYIGLLKKRNGDIGAYYDCLQQATKFVPLCYLNAEYYLATGELLKKTVL